MQSVAYDDVSGVYDERYAVGPLGVVEILNGLACQVAARRLLEVGCGTGHWLNAVQYGEWRYGLDFSAGMLAKAQKKDCSLHLCRGTAVQLPFCESVFDFVFSIHAVQHFTSSRHFIEEAFRLLRPGGVFAIIGMDPHLQHDRWYVYDYFSGTKQSDLRRYPSTQELLRVMQETGFVHCERRLSARLEHEFRGREVLSDPILQKNGASQLSLLSADDFAKGMAGIRKAVRGAEKGGREILFPAHILLPAVIGFAPAQ